MSWDQTLIGCKWIFSTYLPVDLICCRNVIDYTDAELWHRRKCPVVGLCQMTMLARL